ncbi:MAG: hypothetical protein QG625_1695 [Cyanobacteriota bacterium erpe_2018_sw_39hr_WHONDRS-SW48-000098_B_bin.30]|jgi:hypothetical protein|nr:hypothetical protein [Cyanobacteriota bacterium erpe_2018_sw_39hr_WHONDRS-SW48-000098_B_bin.30]
MLNTLQKIAEKEPVQIPVENHEAAIEKSLAYLTSQHALDSIEIDPYWPKWHSPWWHMLLLHELGQTALIPAQAKLYIVQSLKEHYLRFFPIREEEIPSGADPLNQIACHCQLGTMHQVLTTGGVDVDKELPWLRLWYRRYQLDDGGLNCDEAVYTRKVPKSSIVSTLPPLEALLSCANKSEEELECLDRGASYLIDKKLYMRSSGVAIDTEWLKLTFPRFYHYDVLRGLSYLLQWATLRQRLLPLECIADIMSRIDHNFPDGQIKIQRASWQGMYTRYYDSQDKLWKRRPVDGFPLLEQTGLIGMYSKTLTEQWSQARALLHTLLYDELIR